MENSGDRELEAILNLIQLTQTGSVQWKSAKPWGDLKDDENVRYSSVVFCEYLDKRLRLFVERRRIDKPSHMGLLAVISYPADQKFPYWEEKIVLEVTNREGVSLWRFPYKSAIKDLLKAAKYQTAGIKEIIDSLTSKQT